MSLAIKHFYRFGDFTVDTDQRILLRKGSVVALRPKVFETLLILVENSGRLVKKEELMSRLWPDSFVEESNLTFNIKELRKALADDARQPRYIETVARRGYRFIAKVEEVLSDSSTVGRQVMHRFETLDTQSAIGARGVESDFDTGKNGKTEPTTLGKLVSRETVLGRKNASGTNVRKTPFAVVAVAIVLVVGGWLLWSRIASRPPSSPEGRTMIAVLPFDNLTGDADQDYFSDGLTEELIAQLGRFDPNQLGVIARTSVMHYKDRRKSLDQIGRDLGVEYVIEGSVRRDADNVRITVQLIRIGDQTHVWARQYDHQMREILVLQHKIGEEVADKIQHALGKPKPSQLAQKPQPTPQSYEAYDLWLKGQYFWNKRTATDFQMAVEYFQRAIEKDSAYANAYVGLASCYALMGGYMMRPQTEFMPKARTAAERALELDESSAEAHTVLALIVQNYDLDWRKAETEFRRAIELNPSYATAHHWYAEHLMWRGRFEEALSKSDEARRLDPHSLIISADRGAILYYSRQYDRAIEHFRAVREMDPKFQRSGLIIHAYGQKGLFADALAEITAHPPPAMSSPWYWSELTYAYGRSGQHAQAQRTLDKLLELNRKQELGAEAVIWAYLGVGNNEQALAWLEKAYTQRSPAMTYLKVDPRYDPLRREPRFQDLLRRAGLDQY